MTYVFVDPGKHDASFAIFDEVGKLLYARRVAILEARDPKPHLVAALLRTALADWDSHMLIVRAIVERMQVYQTPGQKGAQEDVLDVQLTGGACGLVLHHFGACVEYVYAREWKGQIPKAVSRRRVNAVLTEDEKGRIVWPIASKCHNVVDAIHGGLRSFTTRRA